MNKIDKFDLKLIQELESDPRQTLSKIAKKLNSSQQVISYRIKSLEKRKIIGGYYSIINLTKLGYTTYRTMIRLSDINSNKHKEIIDYLMKHPNVLWLVDCGGRWDLLVNFMAKNIMQYSSTIKEFKKEFPKNIQNYDILPIVQGTYLGRDYFTSTKRHVVDTPILGGDSDIIKLDKTNLKILSLMSENGRINAAEIAFKLKISPNTTISRIKQMKNKGIIQGFKPLLHLDNMGYFGYKALIKFKDLTEKREKDLMDYLKTDLNVVGVINLIGAWDFEVEFETKIQKEELTILRNIRDKFKDIIKEFEVIPLFHEYRYNFLPKI